MAIMVMNFEVDDYDTWKAMFDEDPAGRRQSGATGHVVSRAVDNPNEGLRPRRVPIRRAGHRRSVSVCSPPAPSSAAGCG